MEDREAGFGGGGVAETNGALTKTRNGFAFENGGFATGEVLGERGEIGESFGFDVASVEKPKPRVTARLEVAHEFDDDPAHGVPRVDFHDGFEAAVAVGLSVHERIDAHRSDIADRGQSRFEHRHETVEALAKFERQIDAMAGITEKRAHLGGRADREVGSRGISEELSPGIGQQGGVSEEHEADWPPFELEGEIEGPFEPRFHDQRVAFAKPVFDPLPLGRQDPGFPESDGVGPGESERFLDHDPVVSAGTNTRHGVERGIRGSDGDSDDVRGAHPWPWRARPGRAGGFVVERGEEIAEERGAPRLGIQVGDGRGVTVGDRERGIGDGTRQRSQTFNAVGAPRPGTQVAELATGQRFEGSGFVPGDEFGHAETRPVQRSEEFEARPIGREHNVVGVSQEHGQVGEVPGEGGLVSDGLERGTGGDVSLGERVEEPHGRGAALGLGVDLQVRDELRIEAGGESAFDIHRESFGAAGREREAKMSAEGVPVGQAGGLPPAEPLQTVGHMGDFIVVDAVEQGGGFGVAHGPEAIREVAREIEVGLFEGETQTGDEIERAFHAGHRAPEKPADGKVAELDPAGAHAEEVESGVFLFVAECLKDAAPESGWRVGEPQEDEGHQFDGEKLVIGEEMEKPSAFVGLVELMEAGKAGGGGIGILEPQIPRAPWNGGGWAGRARVEIRDLPTFRRRSQLGVEGRRRQDVLGKLAEFHGDRVGASQVGDFSYGGTEARRRGGAGTGSIRFRWD